MKRAPSSQRDFASASVISSDDERRGRNTRKSVRERTDARRRRNRTSFNALRILIIFPSSHKYAIILDPF